MGMKTITTPPTIEPTILGDDDGTGLVRHSGSYSHDKTKILNRLRRIEGQVRGVQRMVEEEAYCIDILTQISSYIAASEKVASLVLRDHMDHCVREAVTDNEKADEKIAELAEAVERFIKLDR